MSSASVLTFLPDDDSFTIDSSFQLSFLQHLGTDRTESTIPLSLFAGRCLATFAVQWLISQSASCNGSTCHDILLGFSVIYCFATETKAAYVYMRQRLRNCLQAPICSNMNLKILYTGPRFAYEAHSTYISLSPMKNCWCQCAVMSLVSRMWAEMRALPHVHAFSSAIKTGATWGTKRLDEGA
jgi:hypothetical protein